MTKGMQMAKGIVHMVQEKIEPFARKYIVDIGIAAVFIFFALVLAERPKVILHEPANRRTGESEQSQKNSSPDRAVAPDHRPADSSVQPKAPDPWDFTSDEFRIQGKDVRKLCDAIKADHYKLGAMSAPADTVEWLNAVLQTGDLFDKITYEKPDFALTAWIRKLAEQTAENRKKPVGSLKDDERENIKRLNRLTLDLAYAKEAPKSRDLEVRNIFDEDGSYEKPPELIIIPENPYNLIAILQGKERRAILRDYTGRVVSLRRGDKMIDGFVVSEIDKLSVTAKKGKKKREYRIFAINKGKG